MRHLIALLPLLVLVAACDQGPSGIAVKDSHVIGAEVTTNVELQTDQADDPAMVKALSQAVGTVAGHLQSGKVKLSPDVRFGEIHFTITSNDQTRNSDLLTLRFPIDSLRSAHKYADDNANLEGADMLTPGKGPDVLKAMFSYCRDNAAANPKFCGLVATQRAGED
jgi:hypothetical protein